MKVSYDERLNKISNNHKITLKLDTERKENEELFNNILDKFQSKATISIDMKASDINSNRYPSSYDQPSADIIKCPLLKSPDFNSHASKFTKHL